MTSEIMKQRLKLFAINTAILLRDLPINEINRPYRNQLIRSSSSPGANYRAACRAKSVSEFLNKLKIVEEELDESIYFLELILNFNEHFHARINKLLTEANELLSIIVASIKTTRERRK